MSMWVFNAIYDGIMLLGPPHVVVDAQFGFVHIYSRKYSSRHSTFQELVPSQRCAPFALSTQCSRRWATAAGWTVCSMMISSSRVGFWGECMMLPQNEHFCIFSCSVPCDAAKVLSSMLPTNDFLSRNRWGTVCTRSLPISATLGWLVCFFFVMSTIRTHKLTMAWRSEEGLPSVLEPLRGGRTFWTEDWFLRRFIHDFSIVRSRFANLGYEIH